MNDRTKAEKDPGILDIVITVLELGAGRKAACAKAGISHVTLRHYEVLGEAAWKKRETALLKGSVANLSEREELFAGFHDRVQVADVSTKLYTLELIKKAVKGDWRAGAWLMEKLYPREFKLSMRVEAELSGSVDTRPDLSKLTREELWQFKQLLAKTKKEDPDE